MNWLAKAADKLKEAGIDAPKQEILLILSHILRKTLGEVYARIVADGIDKETKSAVESIIELRCQTRKPLAYILGEIEFFGIKLSMNEHVFVPRPETEILVQAVLDALPDEPLIGCDVGTGSGAIAIALLKNRRNWKIIGIDIDDNICELAKNNAIGNDVGDRFITQYGNMLNGDFLFDFVVSNPPYIPTEEISSLPPEIQHEPKHAIDGGEDGLDFIRTLIAGSIGKTKKLFFEFGFGQMQAIEEFAGNFQIKNLKFIKDLANIYRVAIIDL